MFSASSESSVNNYDPTPMVQNPLLQLPAPPPQKPVFDWDLNEDPPVDVNDEIPAPGEEASPQVAVAAVGAKKRKRNQVEIRSNSFNPKKKMKVVASAAEEINQKKEQ